jgi:uncharacterized membrane protein
VSIVFASRGMVKTTPLTRLAVLVGAGVMLGTSTYLLFEYSSLPDLLPVHFRRNGVPNGWQYKTPGLVMMPFFVQFALAFTFGLVAVLLLSRDKTRQELDPADVKAATTAAESVVLIALIWIAVQGYAAIALTRMWYAARAGLGVAYPALEVLGVVLTVVVAVRAHRRVGRPAPRPYVAEHWRLGQLYKNAEDPALFVPTRDGSRWTLNFGRPVAAALLAVILVFGLLGPAVLMAVALR